MTPVVHVEHLRADTGQRTLLDGVSFTVSAGQVLALVGASGSGKTTTGLALLGEHPPGVTVSGQISVTGRVGFVPQQPSAALNPVRRIGGVFGEIAALHGGDPDELRDMGIVTWSVAATQLDVLNIDSGRGHVHIFLPSRPGQGAHCRSTQRAHC